VESCEGGEHVSCITVTLRSTMLIYTDEDLIREAALQVVTNLFFKPVRAQIPEQDGMCIHQLVEKARVVQNGKKVSQQGGGTG